MLDDASVKIKKSKKEKKEKREVFDGEVDVESFANSEELDDQEIPVKSKKEKKDKKKKRESMLEEGDSFENTELQSESIELEEQKPKKKKKEKKEKKESGYAPVDEVIETPKAKKSKKEKEASVEEPVVNNVSISTPMASESFDENTGGAKYWRRLDVEKYQNVVAGTKYADNSHYAKGGDSWGNDAADRLGQVKGKGFKKEMQKLKRASWKGCGSIDTGVNSVQFSDWED